MRRVVAIISVCLLCLTLCLCFPIKGHAMSDDGSDLYYSVLQFDQIETPYYSLPCPFNSASSGTVRQPFEFLDLAIGGFVSFPDGSTMLTGYLDAVIGSYVAFYSSLQVVRMNQLKETRSYLISPGIDGMIFGGADVTCTVVTLSGEAYNSDEVMAAHHTITGSIQPNAAGSVDIGSGLYNILADNGYGDDSYVLLSDLTISLPFVTDTITTPSILISAVTNTYDPALLFGQWVYIQGVTVQYPSSSSTDFDLGSWLANCVTGFVQVEIFPGFSIDKIFYIILVIGVLLWFIKIIS